MRLEGSVILEAIVGLSIAIFALQILTQNIHDMNLIVDSKNQEIDQKLAQVIMNENKLEKITIHDKKYQK